MTKILCVGDIHAMDKPPSGATETYMDDLVDMLAHIAKLERELGADAVVWAGDVFHHKQPSRTSHATVLRMIEAVRRFQNLWIVTGNHDISNDQLSSVHEKQPLGVLFEAGAHELDGWHPTLPLYGVPWQQDWLEEGTAARAFENWTEAVNAGGYTASKSLAVTHAPIYPPSDAESVLFELVPTAGAGGLSEAMGGHGYLYYGHIHEDHGIFTVEGVTYANMGALSRGSLHEYNRERAIKVALWTPEDGFTEVPIPHKPASEVLKVEAYHEEQAAKLNLEAFREGLGSAVLEQSTTEAVIAHIQGLQHVEAPVRAKAVQLLEGVQ